MRTVSASLVAVLTTPALAEPACGLYEYKATITDVHDGDTVTADVDLGFHTWIHEEKFRLLGIDAPEVTGATKAAGIVARDACAAEFSARS